VEVIQVPGSELGSSRGGQGSIGQGSIGHRREAATTLAGGASTTGAGPLGISYGPADNPAGLDPAEREPELAPA
jgi:hypothetical protein